MSSQKTGFLAVLQKIISKCERVCFIHDFDCAKQQIDALPLQGLPSARFEEAEGDKTYLLLKNFSATLSPPFVWLVRVTQADESE